jgi:heterodisulfide reductase subunit C
MILLGLEEQVLTNAFIWLCSSCVSCQEICPQGVRISDFITFLKNLAAKKGYLPVGVRAQLKTIKECARIYPIDEFDNKKRRKINLPPLPTSCEVVKELFSD